jgi:RNA polymerase sigma factor (sigma-70 family)
MTIADTLRHLNLSAPDPRSDGELVRQFVAVRAEPAFAELLRRHGPTVYGVCRRVLGNPQDADDAFQAVFLVLARKAGTVRPPGMVGNWLYGVAVRTANKVRVMNARKVNRRRESPGGLEQHPATHVAGSPDRDTLAVIDAELASLPDVYRAAFVACDLNGRSRSEAARELGWPEGTVAARLVKARELLAARLTKRGITLGVGLFAAAAVPMATASDTLAAVRELLAVGTASAVAPAAQQLSDEVTKTMTTLHTKWLLLGGLVLTLATGGAVLLAAPGGKQPVREQIKAPVPKETASECKEGKPIELEDGRPITGVAVSSDGKYIALTQHGRVELLTADTRKRVYAVKMTEPGSLTAVAFSPKGDKLAYTAKDGVYVRDTATGKGGNSWERKGFDPRQVAWLPDDGLVATNGADVWWHEETKEGGDSTQWTNEGCEQGRQVPLAAIPGHSAYFLTGGGTKKEANELHIVVRPPGSSPQTKLAGHKSRPVSAAVSQDGKRIVSADEGGTLVVWEGEKLAFEEKRRIELGEGVQALALAPDGKTVAVVRTVPVEGSEVKGGWRFVNVELRLFDVTDPPAKVKPLWTEKIGQDHRKIAGPVSLAFSPDGKTLYAAFGNPYNSGEDDKGVLHTGAIPASVGVKVWELVPKK